MNNLDQSHEFLRLFIKDVVEQSVTDRFVKIESSLDQLRLSHVEIQQTQAHNGEELKNNTAATYEVLSVLRSAKSAFKVLGHVGLVAKWFTAVGSAIAMIAGIFHYTRH